MSNLPNKAKSGTTVHSVHKLKRRAQEEERRVQRLLDMKADHDPLDGSLLPTGWARGVKVERVGTGVKRYVQWGVVFTENKGH